MKIIPMLTCPTVSTQLLNVHICAINFLIGNAVFVGLPDMLMINLTCLVSCSSQSLYKVKNFLDSGTLVWKPQAASFTLIIICLSGTIIATVLKLIFRFSGNSCRPA